MALTADDVAKWLETAEPWWIERAEAAGWKHTEQPGDPEGDLHDFVRALWLIGIATVDQLTTRVEAMREWADEALRYTAEEAAKLRTGFPAYPIDPLTVLVLFDANATYDDIARNTGWLDENVEAIEAAIARRTGRRVPYRSAMAKVPSDTFGHPQHWPDALRGPGAKIERARRQVGHLSVDVAAFQREMRLSVEPYVDASGATLPDHLLVVVRDMGDPPLNWSLQAAEIIYNVRSALDQVVYQLALREHERAGKGGTPKGTAWPVAHSKEDFEALRSARRGSLKGVPAEAVTLIEQFQPFPHERWAPRCMLPFITAMSNEDKHRVVRPVLQSFGTGGGFHVLTSGCRNHAEMPVWPVDALVRDGTPVLVLRGYDAGPEFTAEVTGTVSVQVTLGEHGPFLPLLQDAVEWTAHVIGHFTPFFR